MFGSIFALSVDFLPDVSHSCELTETVIFRYILLQGLSGAAAGESLSAVALVVVSYVQLLAEHVDTQLLKDATQGGMNFSFNESFQSFQYSLVNLRRSLLMEK